jgi:hypothetical protein
MNARLATFALVGSLLITTATVACQEDADAGDQLTLEEYFNRLQAAYQKADEDEAELEDRYGGIQSIDVLRDTAPQFQAIADRFIADVEKLEPPEVARAAHEEALNADRALRDEVASFVDAVQDVESVDEFDALADSDAFTAADEHYTEACAALQEMADENDIDVDLGCE